LYFRKINIVHPKFMRRYTIHPIIAYIVHLSGMEGAHINELCLIVESRRTFKHIWFLPTQKAQTKKPKELEFCQRSIKTTG